jgi:hypothetical protein
MSIDECRIKEFLLFYLLKKTERSDIHHSSVVNRHSMKFHTSGASGLKIGQSNRERNYAILA